MLFYEALNLPKISETQKIEHSRYKNCFPKCIRSIPIITILVLIPDFLILISIPNSFILISTLVLILILSFLFLLILFSFLLLLFILISIPDSIILNSIFISIYILLFIFLSSFPFLVQYRYHLCYQEKTNLVNYRN